MKLYCPIHKTEMLRSLSFHVTNPEMMKKGIKQGKAVKTDLQYCIKCNKAYTPKVTFK